MDSNSISSSNLSQNYKIFPESKSSDSLKKSIIILIVIVITVGLSIGGYFGYRTLSNETSKNPQPPSQMQININPSVSNSWITYISATCYLSFQYPSEWVIKINREKNDADNHYCAYKIEGVNDSSHSMTLQTIFVDDLKVWVNAMYSTDFQTPVQIPNADQAIRIDTLENKQGKLIAPIVTYVIQKGKKVYELSFIESSEESKQTYKQIVDSFQLTGNQEDYNEQFRMTTHPDY